MTVVVTFLFRDEVLCVADSRISAGDAVATDSGAKIFSVPVVVSSLKGVSDWRPALVFTLGFAYAGSALAAMNTLALASSCTQNLVRRSASSAPPSLASIATLFRQIAEHYIKDIGGRLTGSLTDIRQYLFSAQIFGFCLVEKEFKCFCVAPKFEDSQLSVEVVPVPLSNSSISAFGSGAEIFRNILREVDAAAIGSGKAGGPFAAIAEMFRRADTPSVGGHFQIGIATKEGFHLRPILKKIESQRVNIQFLGLNTDELEMSDGYSIGLSAIDPLHGI